MAITNTENVLKILYAYNKWWDTNIVPDELLKEYRRPVFYEAYKAHSHQDIRRIVILSGARRTGKTTVMYQTIANLLKAGVNAKNILFVSFDHPLLKMCSIEEVLDIYRKYIADEPSVYLFLDEIQYAESWGHYLKILFDISPKTKIMATGSASSAIEKKAEESGLGRWRVIPVPTLSFYEFLELTETDIPIIDLKDVDPLKLHELPLSKQTDIIMKLDKLQASFFKYIQVGGFPEIALSKDTMYAGRSLREDIIDKAIKKDIPSVHDLRNTNDLERVFVYLCYHSANLINIEAVVKELTGISRITIDKYISYLESANLIYISKAVNLTGKSALKQQNKIYVADSSIRNNILMNSDILTSTEELGILVEGIIYRHIKYYFLNDFINVGYYRTDSKGKEIDIVAHKNNKPYFFAEVKYRESAEIKETEAI
ncbi:MAG: ATP-binding protein, partial [Firmicutes bacterium]|nr:ATP-binding protein [Bacillota bacterium]